MDKNEIQEKINEIQTTFGMTNTRLAEILEMPLNTLKQKKYNEKYRFFEKDLDKLKEFLKSNADLLSGCTRQT